jgi:hypothetical protein
MTASDARPTLIVYRRPACHLCDDAEMLLRMEVEERAARGLVTPIIKHIDVSATPDLESRYGARIPVIAVADEELAFVTSGSRIRALLDRTMPPPA